VVRRAFGPLLGWDAAERDAAWDRAELLLRDSLPEEQHVLYQSHGYIEVPSKLHPGRVYRVDGWRPVAVFEDGQFAGAICIRPREHLPGPDVVLARKLLIEGAEEEFLASGNWLSPAWRPSSAAPMGLLLLVLLSPWLLHLRQFGAIGLAVAGLVLALPVAMFWRRLRRARAGRHRRLADGSTA
jgi:hypothetical protein